MKPPTTADWLDEVLKQLQAQAFYDAVQAIEKLGASDDFTASVNAVGQVGKRFGYHIMNQGKAKQAIEAHIKQVEVEAQRKEANRALQSIKLPGYEDYSHDLLEENIRVFGILVNRCEELQSALTTPKQPKKDSDE